MRCVYLGPPSKVLRLRSVLSPKLLNALFDFVLGPDSSPYSDLSSVYFDFLFYFTMLKKPPGVWFIYSILLISLKSNEECDLAKFCGVARLSSVKKLSCPDTFPPEGDFMCYIKSNSEFFGLEPIKVGVMELRSKECSNICLKF